MQNKCICLNSVDTLKSFHSNLKQPTSKHERREMFWKDFLSNGYLFVSKKYSDNNLKGKVKMFVKKTLKQLELFDKLKMVLKP